ncbi:hypothetical protein LXL04_012751 [Taraxacum kok-saghyz]
MTFPCSRLHEGRKVQVAFNALVLKTNNVFRRDSGHLTVSERINPQKKIARLWLEVTKTSITCWNQQLSKSKEEEENEKDGYPNNYQLAYQSSTISDSHFKLEFDLAPLMLWDSASSWYGVIRHESPDKSQTFRACKRRIEKVEIVYGDFKTKLYGRLAIVLGFPSGGLRFESWGDASGFTLVVRGFLRIGGLLFGVTKVVVTAGGAITVLTDPPRTNLTPPVPKKK